MPPKIYCIRHAQSLHNLLPYDYSIPDPALTDLGKQQCPNLRHFFASHNISAIISPPLKRTLRTSLLSFSPAITANDAKVIALPELQETTCRPCDTGSHRVEIEREFASHLGVLDLSRVEEGWDNKTGRWRPSTAAIDERCRVARCFVRELVGEAGDVAVVLHGGLVHAFTQDWSGYDERHGTAWYNCEFRVYEFLSDSGDQARLIETTESREGRGGVLLTEQEQLRLKALSEKEWEG